jgi:hypothetical protein
MLSGSEKTYWFGRSSNWPTRWSTTFELIEVTQTRIECRVELFDDDAGLLLADPDGTLRVFASSTQQLRVALEAWPLPGA